MRRRRFGVSWPWLALLVGACCNAAEELRDRSCLVNSTYPFGLRRNVTLGGTSQALRIGILNWDSARLMSWMFRIITEEVLGINAVLMGGYGGSSTAFNVLASCKDPETHGVTPGYDGPHVVIGTWVGLSFNANLERVRREYPMSVPISLGSVGYSATDGIFLQAATHELAMKQEHLSLDFYVSYSHPAFDPRRYFDSPWNIDIGMLKYCNESKWFNDAEPYFRLSNDSDGVTITHGPDGAAYSARCTQGKWWLSPACREDTSRCVPIITGGNGWDLAATMQRVAAFKIPAALGIARDFAAYTELPKRHRMLFFWWVPDSSFVSMGVKKVIWPAHDSLEYSKGIRTSQALDYPVTKWACAAVENRSSVGFSQPLATLRNMQFLLFEINELVREKTESAGSPDAALESVACRWLNNHAERYAAWIPLKTACVEQQGLVNGSGAFVDRREDAQECAWCAPGRMSVPLRDSEGNTYRCEGCGAGTFQKSIGMTSCEPCAEGTFAAGRGASSCQRCDFGKYAARQGQTACTGCLPTFVTTFKGAATAEACICPAGFYRDAHERGMCLPCKEGMACPAGSDLLGYLPQRAEEHPDVPLLQPGFWSSREEPLSVFRCADDVRCPGNRRPGSACAPKFELQACAKCQAGHVLSGVTCVPCASGAVQAVLFPALPVVLFMVAVCVFYKLDGKPYARWGSWKSGSSTTVFIVLNYYHIVNVVHELGVISERSATDTLEFISVLSDLLSTFKPQCSGLDSFMSQLILQSHGPGFLCFVYVDIWLASRLIGICRPTLRMDKDRLLNGYLSVILTFFTRIADMAFTIFKCVDNPNGVRTLARDRSVACYQGEWTHMVAVGALAVLLWCIGFAVLLFHAICIACRMFHVMSFRRRWEFLFIRYRPDVHWWAMIILAKGLLLNLGALFITSSLGQIYWILLVLLAYMYLLFVLRPWRHLLNNYVDILVHLSLCLTCCIAAAAAWFANRSGEDQATLGAYVLRTNLALAAVLLVLVVATMAWKELSGRAQRNKDVDTQLILHAIQLMADVNIEDRAAFLEGLTEHDFSLINRTKEVIFMEFESKIARPGYAQNQLSKLSVGRICLAVKERRTNMVAMPPPSDSGSSEPEESLDGFAAANTAGPWCGNSAELTDMAAVKHVVL